MNTKIVYLYRDENNFKTFFDEVLAGSMTKEQETEILNLLAEEGVFIPDYYGLNGYDNCEWLGYESTTRPTTVPMSVEDFINKVRNHAEEWKQEVVAPGEGLKPYAVTIKEVYCKTVIIWARNNSDAEEQADERCSIDEIEFEPDDFVDRVTTCEGLAQADDLKRFEIYGNDEKK